jgi:uncharacterized protein YgbK (DUF1537 family)
MAARDPGVLYAFYGDDFTGSTDVLEPLGLQGVPAVLFTQPPDQAALKAFSGYRAVGIAGESRSRTPKWMDRNLPAIFKCLRALGAPVIHYKVCSTFDSSPRLGSIGRAMELGLSACGTKYVPVVVGAPRLGRSVVFGNLFASADGAMYRIDRHPSMRRHPSTPMDEADLRMHLARQSRMPVGLVDLTAFQSGKAGERLQSELKAGARAIIFDGFDGPMLEKTARLICRGPAGRRIFAVGSSGLTEGLLRYWRHLGVISDAPTLPRPAATDRLIVVSGSCSPATASQIRRARQQGFKTFRLRGPEPEIGQFQKAEAVLRRGESVVLYTALGPPRAGRNGEYGEHFGIRLGGRLRDLLITSGVRRVIIAGGDTATRVVRLLGLTALTFAAPLAPGAPLCRAHAPGSPLDGLELVLKGGQVGTDDFFALVRNER